MKKSLAFVLCLSALALAAAPLAPQIVKKNVKIVRRPITVSVIGEDLLSLKPDEKPTVEAMIEYWIGMMDREIANQPDLIVLPEICDVWRGITKEEKNAWLDLRGDRILKAFQAYAKKYHAYLIYPTYRDGSDGHRRNCSILIDREGDVVAIYDKVYPTVRDLGNGVLPGVAPVIAETDFGRLGFAICFDLNFWDLLDKYAALRPDVIAFSSYYHGDFMLQVWAYKCQAHLIASTIGRLEKNVVTPCGTYQRTERNYFRTFCEKVNTNCRVVHLDFNWDKLMAARSKYGRDLRIDTAGSVGAITLYSENPAIPIDDIIKEFEIETWDQYYARSRAACAEALRNTTAPAGKPAPATPKK